jgi:2-hydroxy-6-oxonona-2,4-dienedioate hydrolase
VLLPGLFAGGWLWDVTWRRLVKLGVDVIRPLDPLAALAETAGDPAALRSALARLVCVELRLERTLLCGNSMGALLALDFARYHPERVAALVLSGAPGLEEGDVGLGAPRTVTREYVDALAERLFHDRRRVTPAMIERTYALLSERRHVVTALRALKAARAYDARAALARVTCPVLMVWGAEDRATPPHAWERAARELPRCEFSTLPDCGHSPMLERPDAFTDLLLAFLRREALREEWAGT